MAHKVCFFCILCMISFYVASTPAYAQDDASALGLKTVVIDPGHGGKDPGAPGKSRSASEKQIVLAVSKLLGEKIKQEYPDVKVLYTRTTDVFVELRERAAIATKYNADLFISIHCNANDSSRPFGASAHILGPKSKNKKNTNDYFEKSISVARRENSVMLLEDDYKTAYQGFDPDSPESVISHSLMWNANYQNSLLFAAELDAVFKKKPFRESDYTGIHQDVFYLLWATNMPAALLEIGFLSNPSDYALLSSASGQEQVAQSLFTAFSSYKKKFDASLQIEPGDRSSVQENSSDEIVKTPEKISYGVQIMALKSLLQSDDPHFKGLKVTVVGPSAKGYYRYVTAYGDMSTAENALKTVRKKFPEAYVVKISGNEVERVK